MHQKITYLVVGISSGGHFQQQFPTMLTRSNKLNNVYCTYFKVRKRFAKGDKTICENISANVEVASASEVRTAKTVSENAKPKLFIIIQVSFKYITPFKLRLRY